MLCSKPINAPLDKMTMPVAQSKSVELIILRSMYLHVPPNELKAEALKAEVADDGVTVTLSLFALSWRLICARFITSLPC